MRKNRKFVIGLTLLFSIVLILACGPSEDVPDEASSAIQSVADNTGSIVFDDVQSDSLSASRSLISNSGPGSSTQSVGIWVTGEGTVSVEPDLVKLNLGVENTADTVEEARLVTALAMTNIFNVLLEMNVSEEDIQTRNFRIYPQYTYQEVYKNDKRYSENVLTSYRVNNSLTVELRDLDNVGVVLDKIVEVAGDSIRIDQVLFTITDASSSRVIARERAVLDALAKAEQFAELTGVTRGDLLYIKENDTGSSGVYNYGVRMATEDFGGFSEIPVSAGDLDIEVIVTTVFAIRGQ
jgi:uncharacterized protein YggE